MAWASPTTINASEGFDSVIPWLTEVTHFWFGRMIMVAIFTLFLMGYMRVKEDDFIGGFAISSFICTIIGMIFWVIGLLSGLDFAIVVGIMAISSLLLLSQKKDH